MPINADDNRYMHLALQIAKKEQGKTYPNPSIGCVIVKDGKILATGHTNAGGVPHAEIMAMKNSSNLEGASMYVTMEPCCHYGKSSPCTKEIVKNKIKRVVIGMVDPNPLVSGNGIKELRNNKIEVDIGCCESEAREQNAGFVSRISQGVPKVVAKIAITKDNFMAKKNNERLKITNTEIDRYIHVLRSKYDGILIGNGTYKKDNPHLNIRLEGYNSFSSSRFVLSSHADIIENSNLYLTKNNGNLYFIVSSELSTINSKELSLDGLRFIRVKSNDDDNFLKLEDVVEQIGQNGINNLLIEPGVTLFDNIIKKTIPDELIFFQSKDRIGKEGLFVEALDKIINNKNKSYEFVSKKEMCDTYIIKYRTK
jgi:diaminohydroxyphosphoribosylaminopyrimidine deaminase/5-amino-6-(5-phosphoribosylamino)uracil reductase